MECFVSKSTFVAGTAIVALSLLASPTLAEAEGIAPPDEATLEARLEVFRSSVPGSIWALQPWLGRQEATAADGTTYRLTSLNPHVNSWFVLEVVAPGGAVAAYHLENADPEVWQVSLAEDGGAPAIRLEDDFGDVMLCAPWMGDLAEARATGLPYAPLCDWSLFLRNPVDGNRTTREAVSDFLRENVIFGDSIVNLIKGAFYEDAFMVSSEEIDGVEEASGVELLGTALLRPHAGDAACSWASTWSAPRRACRRAPGTRWTTPPASTRASCSPA
jgi:hypothetical protein